jgi:uncharacterized protein (DUF362 family)
MNRREFIRLLMLVAASARISGPRKGRAEPSAAPVSPRVRKGTTTAAVAVTAINKGASAESLKRAVRGAIEGSTDFAWLSKGDTVFIKPAVNSGNPYPATTNPLAVATVIEILREKGAKRVIVGDMSGIEHVKLSKDGVTGSSRHLMDTSGIGRAATAAGGELHSFEEAGWDGFFEDPPLPGSHWRGPIMMPNILKEVDHIVLLPRCGRHSLLGSSLGMKNAVGYWRTDTRLEYHRDASTIQEKTAEGNTVDTLRTKQRLVLSTMDKMLLSFGPDKGYVLEPDRGLVVASESIVAHDKVALAWLLDMRTGLPETERTKRKDPYQSQFLVSAANHWVVKRLGGWGPTLAAEKLTRNDIKTIWDDRVLVRAFQIFGGVPVLNLTPTNDLADGQSLNRLKELTTPLS